MDNNNLGNDTEYIRPENTNEITIYFDFKNGKQIYIDTDKNTKFSIVLEELKEKYEWLKNIKIKCFLYNNKEVDLNKSCEQNNIVDSAKISIIDA